MMLSAMSRAAAVLQDATYLARAVAAAEFLHAGLSDPCTGRLYRAAYPATPTTAAAHATTLLVHYSGTRNHTSTRHHSVSALL